MSDYIKRDVLVQAFMDELLDEMPFSLKRELAEKMVDNIPKVDAVEVVRCKDCKYRYEYATNITGDIKHYYICDFLDAENKDDDYCSYGERKDDND